MHNTSQRENVLKALFFTDKHLTAEEIAEKIKVEYKASISMASLYQTLLFLEEVHIIKSISMEKQSAKRYELDLNSHHDHLICTVCKEIIEFYDERIEKMQERIVHSYDFKLQYHNMILYGICKNCQEKE
ncbi:MAG: transcriptional repressor [Epsilonproteobacteria bacterium]|nr:transcriptional repressor [Campylobacterota bacterium]